MTSSTYRDPLDSFTDREQVLELFEHLLRSAQPGQFHLLAIKGNSGTGKTFLIEYLTRQVCPSFEWQTGQLAFAQSIPDFRIILEGLEDALKGCIPRENLKQYRTRRNDFNRSFDEYRATIIISQSIEAKEFASMSGINQNAHVNAELRRRELQLRAEWSRALIELAEEQVGKEGSSSHTHCDKRMGNTEQCCRQTIRCNERTR